MLAANANPILDNIPNASYAIDENSKRPSIMRESGNITFYSFDGNPIITVDHPLAYHCYWKVNTLRLDPAAPKPQPVTYAIKLISKKFWSKKCAIIFYDKHDNVIAEFECYQKSNSLSIIFKDPTKKPGVIGEFTKVTAPNWALLKDIITSMKWFPLDLSRVTEKI